MRILKAESALVEAFCESRGSSCGGGSRWPAQTIFEAVLELRFPQDAVCFSAMLTYLVLAQVMLATPVAITFF